MLNSSSLVKISKFLSKHLRHQPEKLGLNLDAAGWVYIDDLLAACLAHQFTLTREELEEVVMNNDKQRFAFDVAKTKIRAVQGHSIPIDLQLTPQKPNKILYHGTATKFLPSIKKLGLIKRSRHHVHLSSEAETALKVGARHGKPVVLIVKALAMYENGYTFYCSDNGVWLVEEVAYEYLIFPDLPI